MKKLDVMQMEDVCGSLTFDQCMNNYLSHWQISGTIGFFATVGGLGGFLGGMSGLATRCLQLAD